MLTLQPIDFNEACKFVEVNHSHHKPPRGWKFGIAVNNGDHIVGVIMVGRPVARMLDDGWTLEITRCATTGEKNAASMLYGAAARAVFALGYKRLVTYTLETEDGTCLVAAGYKEIAVTRGGSWSRVSRLRVDVNPTVPKKRWEKLPNNKEKP
jgi:hypothetical protein